MRAIHPLVVRAAEVISKNVLWKDLPFRFMIEGEVSFLKKRIRLKLGKQKIENVKPKKMVIKANIPKFAPAEVNGYLQTVKYVLGGKRWRIHDNDPDGWPSRPHGDELGGRHKLDVIEGIIYNRTTRKQVGKLSKKELYRLHNDPEFKRILKKVQKDKSRS